MVFVPSLGSVSTADVPEKTAKTAGFEEGRTNPPSLSPAVSSLLFPLYSGHMFWTKHVSVLRASGGLWVSSCEITRMLVFREFLAVACVPPPCLAVAGRRSRQNRNDSS